MRSGLAVKIDVAKAETVRKNNGMNRSEFSKSLCHNASYWGEICRKGRMGKADAALFKATYGVDIILPDAAPEKPKKDKGSTTSMDLDYNKLADVLAGVIDYDKLSDAMYRAMVRALNGDDPVDDPAEDSDEFLG